MADWAIVCEPQGKNPGTKPKGSSKTKGKNEGGVIVYLSDGGYSKQEVARVGFERKNTINPDVMFEVQLASVVAKARAAVKLLNTKFVDSGELQ